MSGSFQEGIASSMQYGSGIKALAVTLNTEGMMSVSRIQEFLSAALGLPVCAGTVCHDGQRTGRSDLRHGSHRLSGIAGKQGQQCRRTRVSLRRRPIFAPLRMQWRFYVSDRAKEARRTGDADDCFSPKAQGVCYLRLFGILTGNSQTPHALYNSHILRELIGLYETTRGRSWRKICVAFPAPSK